MLFIQHGAKARMIADAIHAFPDECCGFLFGKEAEDRVITQIKIVQNAKEGDKRRRFEIAPADYLAAERYAEENNLMLLGVYHSHPNHPAIPSEHDRVAAQPYFSYVILSIVDGRFADIRSWQLNEEHQFETQAIAQPLSLV